MTDHKPTAANLSDVDHFVKSMKAVWDSKKVPAAKRWQFWSMPSVSSAFQFLITIIDELVAYFLPNGVGPDQKAVILAAFGQLYDYVVTPLMPLLLRPFAGFIRDFFINVVASHVIDFIVGKYLSGNWKPLTQAEVAAKWAAHAPKV